MPRSIGTFPSNAIKIRKTKSGGIANKLPHQVLRRNERERKRVQQVGDLILNNNNCNNLYFILNISAR